MRWMWDWEYAWRLTWFIVLATVVPLGLGLWLDRRWGTMPFLTLAGVMVGLALTLLGIQRLLR